MSYTTKTIPISKTDKDFYNLEVFVEVQGDSSKLYKFAVSELDATYSKTKGVISTLNLKDPSVHKSVKFKDDSATLVSVVGQDPVGESTETKTTLIEESVYSISINEVSYQAPYDLDTIYQELTGEVLLAPDEDTEIESVISWWDTLSYDQIEKVLLMEGLSEEVLRKTLTALAKHYNTIEEEVTPPAKKEGAKSVIKEFQTEEQISIELIAEPFKLDLHNEWYSAETIAKGCENFNKNLTDGNMPVNLFHLQDVPEDIEVLDSYIMPVDCIIGKTEVSKGTWVGELKWHNKSLWDKRTIPQKDGTLEIAGVSINGKGVFNKPATTEE